MKSVETIFEEVKAEFEPLKVENPDALFFILEEKAAEYPLSENDWETLCKLAESI